MQRNGMWCKQMRSGDVSVIRGRADVCVGREGTIVPVGVGHHFRGLVGSLAVGRWRLMSDLRREKMVSTPREPNSFLVMIFHALTHQKNNDSNTHRSRG